MSERREHARFPVFGGNAEITKVRGRGKAPSERARILNWSRGGLLLKVKSPERRLLFQKLDPVLWQDDDVSCTVRLPPSYGEVVIRGEVVRVERDRDDPDHLQVGIRFDSERTKPGPLDEMVRALEPRSRSGRIARASVSGRMHPARTSQRLAKRRNP